MFYTDYYCLIADDSLILSLKLYCPSFTAGFVNMAEVDFAPKLFLAIVGSPWFRLSKLLPMAWFPSWPSAKRILCYCWLWFLLGLAPKIRRGGWFCRVADILFSRSLGIYLLVDLYRSVRWRTTDFLSSLFETFSKFSFLNSFSLLPCDSVSVIRLFDVLMFNMRWSLRRIVVVCYECWDLSWIWDFLTCSYWLIRSEWRWLFGWFV